MRSSKTLLKRLFPGLPRVMRRLGRFRFLLKARQVRTEGVRFRDDPLSVIRYVALDPETHSYSYELDNVDELCRFLERVTDRSGDEIGRYVEEALGDPELGDRLRRRVRWRIDCKRDMPVGNRLLWYALVRATKPAVIVETGIYQGLGSLILLRALHRNAQEGAEGQLISIDLDPESGWLVPERLRGRWTPVFGAVEADLETALTGVEVDLFVHESDHNQALQRFEFVTAITHSAPELHVIDSSGLDLPVLRELCDVLGGEQHLFVERPRRHFYQPVGTAVAVFGLDLERGPLRRTGHVLRQSEGSASAPPRSASAPGRR